MLEGYLRLMRVLHPITEDEMIAVFLRAELESERFAEKLGGLLARDGVEFDPADDAYRRRLLDEHRAYERREGLLLGFPREVDWFRAAPTRDEVLDILFINWSWKSWRSSSASRKRCRAGAGSRHVWGSDPGPGQVGQVR
jgi:hypothetical protein